MCTPGRMRNGDRYRDEKMDKGFSFNHFYEVHINDPILDQHMPKEEE